MNLQCEGSQIGFLANLWGDGALELVCNNTNFPRRVHDYSTIPFIDRASAIPRVSSVVDAVVADFDGDLETDIFLVRGAKRLSGATQVAATAVEIHLVTSAAKDTIEEGASFRSSGDVTVTITTDDKIAASKIFIGSSGVHPTAPLLDKFSIRLTLARNSSVNHGIAAHQPATNTGIYIGYDPPTERWTILNSPGGAAAHIHASFQSTSAVSDVSVSNLGNEDLPLVPVLYVQNGGTFTNRTQAVGLGEAIMCIAAAAGDFDNDMDVDLYAVCRGAILNMENRLYENLGQGTFALVANAAGAAGPTGFGVGLGENVVTADYDVDGRLDLFVTNGLQMVPIGPGGPDVLLRNTTATGNHWIQLDLQGTVSNRDGVGARVFARDAGGGVQLREQNGGYHRWAQNSQRIHFGLASHTAVDLEVQWPNGAVDTYTAVPADHLYRLVEGTGIQQILPGGAPVADIPQLTIADVAVFESDGIAHFPVSLIPASNVAVQVQFATENGTASAPSDFNASSGTLTFAPGVTTQTIDVVLVVDGELEPPEQFVLRLSAPVGARFGTAAATATIQVPGNSAPVALAQSLLTPRDTVLPVTLSATDPDGDFLTFLVTEPPSHGSLSGVPPDLLYTPSANFLGPDAFEFIADDGLLTSEPARVEIVVDLPNNPPVADGQEAVTLEDQSVAIELAASDPDGDPLTFSLITFPTNGTLSGTPPSLFYTPNADFAGSDSFTFAASDGRAATSANVGITVIPVNDAPIATAASVATRQDTSIVFTLAATDPDGDTLTFTLVSLPSFGTLSGDLPTMNYTPSPAFTGVDTFEFSVSDAEYTSAPAAVTISVNILNRAPTAGPQSVTTDEDSALPITLTGSDPDGDTLTFSIVDAPAHGSLAGALPALAYVPAADFAGTDAFTFTVNDGSLASDVASVNIAINPINDPPVAAASSVQTEANTPVEIMLQASDVEDDALTYAITVPPNFGILTGNAPNLTYTPTSGFHGADQFSFTASDDTLVSNAGIVMISVNPLPGGPAPVTAWVGPQGGVSVDGNRATFSGAPTTWTNTVRSVPVSTLGLMTPYEVFFTLETSPAAALWVVGLGVTDSGPNWTDIDYGLRNSNGTLQIYENGTFRVTAGALAQGDVISIAVSPGVVEYRRNSVFVYRQTYAGSPDLYVDTAFKQGVASLSVSVTGNASDPPPSDLPISSWQGAGGGVTSAGSDVSYSGSPTGWKNTIRSAPLASLGAGANFAVRWTVGPDPTGSLWIVGLGITESGANWTDIDYGLRNSNGALKVYENGTLIKGAGTLAAGDVLSIRVAGDVLEYRRNDALIISRSISPGAEFYIDTSFKEGAAQLTGFTLSNSP